MNKICLVLSLAVLPISAFAVDGQTQGRRSVASQMVMSAPRVTVSKNQIDAMASVNNPEVSVSNAVVDKASIREPVVAPAVVDNREKEKAACINNNIGIGNTFVWASRYSNTNNYASMVEDTENPENNTCFVKVELKSNDARISVSDVPAKYYEWGKNITCGDWANASVLEQRIKDAKKTERTWATVGGVVGGAGVGVGAMELFGNRLIGGKVEGQKNKNLTENEVLRSQLLAVKNSQQYNDFMQEIRELKSACESEVWAGNPPEECKRYDYNFWLSL